MGAPWRRLVPKLAKAGHLPPVQRGLVVGGEVPALTLALLYTQQGIQHGLNIGSNGPTTFVDHPTGMVYHPTHVGYAAVLAMGIAVQSVDEVDTG